MCNVIFHSKKLCLRLISLVVLSRNLDFVYLDFMGRVKQGSSFQCCFWRYLRCDMEKCLWILLYHNILSFATYLHPKLWVSSCFKCWFVISVVHLAVSQVIGYILNDWLELLPSLCHRWRRSLLLIIEIVVSKSFETTVICQGLSISNRPPLQVT